MTWLYIPEIFLASAQVSEASNSESASLSTISERLAASSVQWRGKPLPPQAWSRRWKLGGFIRHLSGLTCSPSTLDRGAALFISSLRATHAKKTALPENMPEVMGYGSSPPRSSGLPANAGLIVSSAKTCRGMLTDSLQLSSQHWKGWATALRQEYSVRPKPAIPCGAKDCSSWPSARTSDTNGAGMHGDGGMDLRTAATTWLEPDATNRVRDAETLAKCAAFRKANANQNTVPLYLAEVAREWMAPRASDAQHGGPNQRDSAGNPALPSQSAQWHVPRANDPEKRGTITNDPRNGLAGQGENWPAPATRDHKGSSEGSIMRQDGKSRADMLDFAAEQFFRLPSSPDRPIAGGAMSSTDGPNSNQLSVKRKLNPMFVEALMRWPTGLSGFERQETALIRWWQLMPIFLLMLCSQPENPQMSLFGDAA